MEARVSNTFKKIAYVFVTLALAAVFEVFLVLCLGYFAGKWNDAVWLVVLCGGSVLNAAVLAVDLTFFFLKKPLICKSCLTVYIVAVFFAVLFFILLKTGFWEIISDKERFQEYLEKSGKWIVFVFILLQFAQVVILPIPSTVTVVAGSALFGPLWGSIYSLIGIILGSLVGFLVGRYAGYHVVSWLVGKETLDKWLKKIKGKDKLLLSAMFLLPVFPDDVLCFVAGISSMSIWLFLGVILVSRVLAVFTTSYSITLIPLNTWWGILIWVVLFALVVVLFVVLYKKSDAILGWIAKKFHRETRVQEEVQEGEFPVEIVDSNGNLVEKGVKKGKTSRNSHKK